jgi:PAS domain-containing protein
MVVQRYDVQRPDGAGTSVLGTLNLPVTGPDGAVRYILHHVEDVTDREHDAAERGRLLSELAAEHERLRAVVLHMPAPVALLSGPDHRFELVNDPYRRVSGGGATSPVSRRSRPFRSWRGRGSSSTSTGCTRPGSRGSRSRRPSVSTATATACATRGSTCAFEPVRDAAGRVTGILNLAVDVTAQVLARRQTEALLAQSERARGRPSGPARRRPASCSPPARASSASTRAAARRS